MKRGSGVRDFGVGRVSARCGVCVWWYEADRTVDV